jgi:hypothetical protein
LTNEIFISRANILHNYKYDYSKTEYISNSSSLNINCNKHGIFSITPEEHISCERGCPKCAKENIKFKKDGEHKEYYQKFYEDLFYNPDNKNISDNIHVFFDELFDCDVTFTKSDLDLLTELYKMLDKSLILKY